MSNIIDERIVEMRFDNRDFESNVKTSMNTLDKLNQKLDLKGASKGLENIQAASSKINLSNVQDSVDKLTAKFSTLDVVGVTAISNLTNRAVNAGISLSKSLSIDQVVSGWNKYSQKTASVQTIMNATGKSIDEVNSYLEQLMWFSDETSYGFTDMTAALGQMASSGGNVEKLLPLIMGVANATAYAGKGAGEFSRVMYNLNQSYGSGSLQYMDWKSVELAGVGSKELKQIFIDTAEAMGKIKKGEVTIANFGNTLKDKWADTEVMEKSFGKFYEMTEKAYEMVKNGDVETASEAYEILSKQYDNISLTAAKAAQEAKTFGEAIDATKDAVSSQFMRMFETVFGNYDKAKRLWTDFANTLYDLFALPISNFADDLESAFNRTLSPIKTSFNKVKEPIQAVNKTLEELDAMAKKVWRGDFGNGEARLKKLTEEGYNYYRIQNKVNELMGDSYRFADEIVQSQDDLLYTSTELNETIEDNITNVEEFVEALLDLSDEQLLSKGYTEEQISAFRELSDFAKKTGLSIGFILDNMDEIDGRWLFIESFKNVGRSIIKILENIKEAWDSVFNPDKDEDKRANAIYNFVTALHKLSRSFILSDETAEKLQRTFKGLFSLLHTITTIVKIPLTILGKLLGSVFKAFNMTIWDITASIGDALVAFDKWIQECLDFTGIVNFLTPVLKGVVEQTKNWYEQLRKSEALKIFAEYIQLCTKALWDWLVSLKDSWVVKEFISLILSAAETLKNFYNKIKDTDKFKTFVKNMNDSIESFKEWIKGIKSADNIGKYILDGLFGGLKDNCSGILEFITNFAGTIISKVKEVLGIHSPSTEFYEIGKNIMLGAYNGVSDMADGLGTFVRTVFEKILEIVKNLDIGTIVTVGISASFLKILNDISTSILSFSKPFESFASIFTKVANTIGILNTALEKVTANIGFKMKTEGIKDIAISLAILSASVFLLSKIKTDDLFKAIVAIGVLGALMAALLWFLNNKLVSNPSTLNQGLISIGKLAVLLISFAVSVSIMAGALKKLSSVSELRLWNSIAVLLVCIGGLLGLAYIVGNSKNVFDKGSMILISMGASVYLMGMALTKIAKIKKEDLTRSILTLGVMVVAIIALMASMKLLTGSTNVGKIGGALTAIATTFAIMAMVIKILGKMKPNEFKQGMTALILMEGLIIALIASTKLLKGSKYISDIGNIMLKLSGAFVLMAIAIKILGKMKMSEISKGIFALSGMSLIIGLLMKMSNSINGDGKLNQFGFMMLSISGAFLIIAMSIKMLGGLEMSTLVKGIAAVGLLSLFVAYLMKTTASMSNSASIAKTAPVLIAAATCIGIMAAIAVLLGMVKTENLVKGLVAVGLITSFVSLLMYSTQFMQGGLSTIIMMTILLGVMTGMMIALSKIEPERLISTATSLGVLLLSLTSSIMILSRIKISWSEMAKIGVGLVGMILALGAMALILGLMGNVSNAAENANALSVLLLSMSVALMILAGVGAIFLLIPGSIELMLVALASMILAILGIIGLLWLMPTDASSKMESLSNLLRTMTETLLTLALVAPLVIIGVSALASLTTLMIAIGAFAIAVGWLFEVIPELEGFLDKGIPILVKVAGGIGMMIGAFTGGILSAISITLPLIGQGLSDFMTNLEPFIEKSKTIDKNMTDNIGRLSRAIILLTAAELFNAIATFLSGNFSFSNFGKELSKFMVNLTPFLIIASTIDPKVMEGVKNLGDAILALTGAQLVNSIGNFLSGDRNMTKFSKSIKEIGKGIADFIWNIKKKNMTKSDIDKVSIACEALKAIAEVMKVIPTTGGLKGFFNGNIDTEQFAKDLESLGTGITKMLDSLKSAEISKDSVSKFKMAAECIEAIANANGKIPNTGGMVSWFTGDNSLETFTIDMARLIFTITGLVDHLVEKNFNENSVSIFRNAVECLSSIIEATNTIVGVGGMKSMWNGDNSITTFANSLKRLGTGMSEFVSELGNNFESKKVKIDNAINLLYALSTVRYDGNNNDLKVVGESLDKLGSGLKSFIKSLIGIKDEDIATAIDKLDKVIEILKKIESLKGGELLNSFNGSMSNIGKNGLKQFIDNLSGSNLSREITFFFNTLCSEISGNSGMLKTTFTNLVKAALPGLTSQEIRNKLVQYGKDFANGFAKGISDKESVTSVNRASSGLVSNALSTVKRTQASNSPSKKTFLLGKYFTWGFAKGITDNANMVQDSSESITEYAISSLGTAMNSISDLIENGIDSNPTIRPVLDLSNVNDGIDGISDMFRRQKYSLATDAGYLSSSMNMRIQNATNNDIISAVNSLGKSLSNTGTTNNYNVNGITYDDGSNVSSAVAELVRATRIDRRS